MHDISTADSGSMYPHTATVFTGSADIEEKYNKQPSPVFINPRKTRGEILLCGILTSSKPLNAAKTALIIKLKNNSSAEFSSFRLA